MILARFEKTPGVEMVQKILAEFCGTFILVFSVGITQGGPDSVAPALWAAMLATGYISGGQFNPAVSIAVLVNQILTRSSDLKDKFFTCLIYILVQLASSIVAAGVAYLVIDTNDKRMAYFDLANGITDAEGFLAEAFYTTILTGVAVIGGTLTKSTILVGGLVSTTVSAGDYAVGNYTGGCFNPAVGFGINLMHRFAKGGSYHRILLYIFAPAVGGVIGGTFATIFSKMNKEVKDLRKEFY